MPAPAAHPHPNEVNRYSGNEPVLMGAAHKAPHISELETVEREVEEDCTDEEAGPELPTPQHLEFYQGEQHGEDDKYGENQDDYLVAAPDAMFD